MIGKNDVSIEAGNVRVIQDRILMQGEHRDAEHRVGDIAGGCVRVRRFPEWRQKVVELQTERRFARRRIFSISAPGLILGKWAFVDPVEVEIDAGVLG